LLNNVHSHHFRHECNEKCELFVETVFWQTLIRECRAMIEWHTIKEKIPTPITDFLNNWMEIERSEDWKIPSMRMESKRMWILKQIIDCNKKVETTQRPSVTSLQNKNDSLERLVNFGKTDMNLTLDSAGSLRFLLVYDDQADVMFHWRYTGG
jgi:hypothetical protein